MHLAVCIKQILDPEIPPADFRLAPDGQSAAAGTASQVISIFDENALEVALQARDAAGGGKITALSLGPASAVDALRKALSMRVDDVILLPEENYPALDARGAARVLAAAIRKLEKVDLVLCGRETGDWHGGLVAGYMAAELDSAYTSLVASAKISGDKLELRRQSEDGWEIVESAVPAVVSVTNDGGNLPRIPKVKDNMLAFRKQVPSWSSDAIGVAADQVKPSASALAMAKLYVPVVERNCEMIQGENSSEKAQQLVAKLAALQVI